ncbi:MAG: hypothetical protein ACRECV_11970 [Xanthobacteraceae bacterium]
MGRLVRKPQVPHVGLRFEGLEDVVQTPQPTAGAAVGDDYLQRVVKYIPAEIVGGLMVVNAILSQAMTSAGHTATMAGVSVTFIADGALIIAVLLTPLFCWYVREDGDAWVINALVSTLALPFWAYLMDAVAFVGHYDGNLAAILVLTFAAVSGLVSPPGPRPKRRRQRLETAAKEAPRLVETMTA